MNKQYIRKIWCDSRMGLLFTFLSLVFIGHNYNELSREEITLIFARAGIINIPEDPFIKHFFAQYTAVTPYVYFFGAILKLVGRTLFEYVSLFCVGSSIFFIYQAIKRLSLFFSSSLNELSVFFIVSFILFLDFPIAFQPDYRNLFWVMMDPEMIALPFFLFSYYYWISGRQYLSVSLFVFSLLIHPLYGLMLFIILLLTELLTTRKKWKHLGYLAAILIPYFLFLYYQSKSESEVLNANLIHELVAFPQHLKMLSLNFERKVFHIRYLEWIGFVAFISWILRSKGLINKRVMLIAHTLTAFLFFYIALIVINQVFHPSLLIVLTPMRSSTFTMVLIGIFIGIYVLEFIHTTISNSQFRTLFIVGISTIFFAISAVYYQGIVLKGLAHPKFIVESENWIKENTPKDTKFLNYTKIRVQVECNRYSYYEIGQFGYTERAQVDWYKRIRCFHAVPASIKPREYDETKRFIDSEKDVNLNNVLSCINMKIDYIVLNQIDLSKYVLPDMYKTVFENDGILILKLPN